MSSLADIAYLLESGVDTETLIILVQRDYNCDRARAIEAILNSLVVLHNKAHELMKIINISLYTYDVELQKCLRNN